MTSAEPDPTATDADLEEMRLGRYDVVARLATGGMAEVLLARLQGARGFERAVVLKRVLPHLARQEHFRRMFMDEALVLAAIAHPNVVQVHELGEEGPELFLVMEYVAGESLASVLRRLAAQGQRLAPEIAAHVVAEAAAGLHAAHELVDDEGDPRNVVHRDVSPHNVMITYDGQVKVLDFGIAKSEDASTHTESGVMKGKFAYMAPEQYHREPVDRRTDIFALGTVLWEAAASRRLFARDSDVQTLRAICDDPIPRLTDVSPGIPEGLDDATAKALARKPEDRFQTAQDFRIALVDAIRDFAPGSHPREELQRVMERLFVERKEEKREMLRRVKKGTALTHVPPPDPSTMPTEAQLGAPKSTRRRWLLSGAVLLGSGAVGAFLALRQRQPTPMAIEAPPPEPVSVRIQSRPEGARVRFGEQVLGPTPVDAEVPASSESVTVSFDLEGYEPLQERVVPDGDVHLRVMLVPEPSEPAAGEAAAPTEEAEDEEASPEDDGARRRRRRRSRRRSMEADPEYYRFD